MKKILSILTILLILFSVSACSLVTTKNKENQSTLSERSYHIFCKDPYIDLYSGEMKYIEYTTDFTLEGDDKITFTSSNPEVVRCIQTGYIVAKSKGECTVTVSYKDASLLLFVSVNQDSSITPPTKLTYYTGESIDLTGCQIILYNQDESISKEIDVTNDMLDEYDTSTKGEKEIRVNYENDTYHFTINVIEREYEPFLLDSVTLDGTLTTGEKIEFNIKNKNITSLLDTIKSPFDYDEYKIIIDIERPDGSVDSVYSYYNQDYKETRKKVVSMNTGRNYEGTVVNKEGYNYQLTLTKDGSPYYKANYIAPVNGTYSYTIKAYSNGETIVDMLNGEFNVTGNETSGSIKVSNNNKTFMFQDGTPYFPVGENLAWYTSQERRYIDYEMWMDSLGDAGANYIRIWLSGFSFSLFWDDLYDYSTKLDEAYELDKVFDLAKEKGIYINLTLFHHGMFSKKINPMWPNDVIDWYVNKYGANPYSKILSSPGEFYKNQTALKLTKNYLTYLAARYGYSNNLFSYELFNELDWVEEYDVETGNKWHDEMAKHLKSIDYKNHLVTTSIKDDDLSSKASTVFNLDSIDYVNVHNYGSSNYYKTISQKSLTAYSKFNKPIIYQEVGYDGNSGQSQINKDPNDVTLHQELWAGLMSVGATGMNWWWDSWIEPHNSYSMFKGPSLFAKEMKVDSNTVPSYKSARVSLSLGYSQIGFLSNDKAYIYVYSNNYSLNSTGNTLNATLKVSGFENGSYEIDVFDTFTGLKKSTNTVNASNGTIQVNVSGKDDCAISIIKK